MYINMRDVIGKPMYHLNIKHHGYGYVARQINIDGFSFYWILWDDECMTDGWYAHREISPPFPGLS